MSITMALRFAGRPTAEEVLVAGRRGPHHQALDDDRSSGMVGQCSCRGAGNGMDPFDDDRPVFVGEPVGNGDSGGTDRVALA